MNSPLKKYKYYLFFILIFFLKSVNSQTLKDSLLIKLSSEKRDTVRIDLLLEIGKNYYYTYPDTAYFYYKKALDLSKKIKNTQKEAQSLVSIGFYFDSKELFKKSIAYYSEAITLYKLAKDEKGLANCYNYIGYSFAYLNSLNKSIEYYHKSLDIFEKLNDSLGLATIYNSLGNLHYDQEKYDKAQDYFFKAFNIYNTLNNKEGLLSSYINLGNAMADSGEVDEGLKYYSKSIDLTKELKDNLSLAITYNNIGDCYLVKEEYHLAMNYFNKALKIVKQYNYETLYELVFASISNTYLKLGDYNKAIEYANISLEYSKEASWASIYYDNHLTLSKAYEGLGNYKKAYENHKLFKKYSDSIFNAKKHEQIAKSEMLYELENQEKKIDILIKNEEIRKGELKNQKILNYVLILFSVVFLTLIFLLNNQRKSRNKANFLLSIQKEKAIESDRLKSSFLANMSHEIRTPMSAIMGFSSFLKDPDLSDEKRNKFVDIINHSGERLMTIINDIIDISKIESNQLKIDISKINVVKTLQEIIEIQKETNTLLTTKKIDLKLNLASATKDIFIKTDETRFAQIFNNLINNASKFTEKGFIEVGFIFKNYKNTEYLQFYVKDTGCGIPENKFEEIFDRFSQAGDKDFKRGNGLGLSICKGLMLKLGGEIWLKSEVGLGTTFYFTLPY